MGLEKKISKNGWIAKIKGKYDLNLLFTLTLSLPLSFGFLRGFLLPEVLLFLDDTFHISVVEPIITLSFPLELFETCIVFVSHGVHASRIKLGAHIFIQQMTKLFSRDK